MYCIHCGQQINESNIFCPGCGARLETSPSADPALQTLYQQPAYHTQKMKPDKLGLLTASCVAAIFLCWPAAVYGFVQRHSAMKETSLQEANMTVERAIKGIWIWILVACIIGFVIGFIGAL